MTAVAAITCLQIDVSSWADIADLRLRPSLSYRGIPLLTVVNGTIIMAVWRSSHTASLRLPSSDGKQGPHADRQ